MEWIYKFILGIHVSAGTFSLISFWIPAFTRKGGRTHRLVGKGYVITMWIVVVTALLLSVINLSNQKYIIAAFLGFLSILTAQPLWYGIAILRYKNAIPDSILNIRKALHLVLTLGGAGMIIWSILLKLEGMTSLLMIFGILGLTSVFAVLKNKEKTRKETHWLWEHISGMIVSGIAAYTAFFAFGGSTFFSSILPDSFQIIPWVLPTIIGVISLRILRSKWDPA